MNRRELFWYVLLIASFVAAMVSLLTTALGLDRYLHFALAWSLAVAVQLGLFGLAWLIAVGRGSLRGLVVVLYLITMPFSVLFSYVMLQSEFTAEVRVEETQRALFDDLRARNSTVAAELGRGLSTADDLAIRLDGWLAMERDAGWTTSTCDADSGCYLGGVCDRLQRRIATWEDTTGRPYRQGPGEQLIFGLLTSERESVEQIRTTLRAAQTSWLEDETVFAGDVDNRERIRRFDQSLAQLPRAELEAVRCEDLALPVAPPYDTFSRDNTASEERPIWAFEDLVTALSSDSIQRRDYPTLFAFGLALFVDLFVLLVAIGAAVLQEQTGGARAYPATEPVPQEWGDSLQRDITGWIDGALLGPIKEPEQRQLFLRGVLDALRFDRGTKALLVPRDAQESRFGYLMTSSQAAKPTGLKNGEAETVGFVLEDWVYPALTRYISVPSSA